MQVALAWRQGQALQVHLPAASAGGGVQRPIPSQPAPTPAHQGMHMVLELGFVSRPARHESQVGLQQGRERDTCRHGCTADGSAGTVN